MDIKNIIKITFALLIAGVKSSTFDSREAETAPAKNSMQIIAGINNRLEVTKREQVLKDVVSAEVAKILSNPQTTEDLQKQNAEVAEVFKNSLRKYAEQLKNSEEAIRNKDKLRKIIDKYNKK